MTLDQFVAGTDCGEMAKPDHSQVTHFKSKWFLVKSLTTNIH